MLAAICGWSMWEVLTRVALNALKAVRLASAIVALHCSLEPPDSLPQTNANRFLCLSPSNKTNGKRNC